MENLAFNRASHLDFAVNNEDPFKLAKEILKTILQFRRSPSNSTCNLTCHSCQSLHLSKVASAIKEAKPITFVLPAFPGKSPNLSKVLGPLPDMAEELALQFLEQLCEEIKGIYAPGAQIIICSDGRVFSDIVGMRETDVTDYQHELEKMIHEFGLKHISLFNLDELCGGEDFIQVRHELVENFGVPLAVLKEKVLRGSKALSLPEEEEAHRVYCGITRFLVEDSTFPGQTKSRSAIQKECRVKAYEVIRRSNAWSELIAQRFPEAVRLSIHPQTCGSKKIGIRLIATETWMTPWHGVAVKANDEFTLLKRIEAEALGAQLVFADSGRPSHFEFPKNIQSRAVIESAEV